MDTMLATRQTRTPIASGRSLRNTRFSFPLVTPSTGQLHSEQTSKPLALPVFTSLFFLGMRFFGRFGVRTASTDRILLIAPWFVIRKPRPTPSLIPWTPPLGPVLGVTLASAHPPTGAAPRMPYLAHSTW